MNGLTCDLSDRKSDRISSQKPFKWPIRPLNDEPHRVRCIAEELEHLQDVVELVIAALVKQETHEAGQSQRGQDQLGNFSHFSLAQCRAIFEAEAVLRVDETRVETLPLNVCDISQQKVNIAQVTDRNVPSAAIGPFIIGPICLLDSC